MNIIEYIDRTVIDPRSDQAFIFLAQVAISEAKRRGLPAVFPFEGRNVIVYGNEKTTQVYSDYLKRCKTKPTTTSNTLDDILCSLGI